MFISFQWTRRRKTAVVRIRIVHDVDSADGTNEVVKGVTLKYFERTIPFPPPPGYKIRNPIFCDGAAKYLRTWLREPAFWSFAIIYVLQLAWDKHVQSSNQLCEAFFKHKKAHREELKDACDDPASYTKYWWDVNKQECQVFGREVESAKRKFVSRRKRNRKNLKAAKLQLGPLEVPTADAIANVEADKSTPQWKPGHRGKKAENYLRARMNLIFSTMVPRPRSLKEKRALLILHLDSHEVGTLKGMGGSTWSKFIQGQRENDAKRIPEGVMKLFESFVRYNEGVTEEE
ncbi:hypothetical protein THAOC_00881 [Thalassiosira oceanica]|uniref:Uncharacterized protein n=1 Tax=Thalassiosira oceanica TaxID=159749 RepID=K0TJH8_THAOC|nr:hypothetical protein THAOC_00881 [Thalassiosira oceanica]|eukprot:EJK77294.1 hypothetical protein THAOC_00881 [Thalassiosira oceanica]